MTSKWREKCNPPQIIEPLTEKTWGQGCVKFVISFPDLLWTKPKARSGKVRKFVFLDWLLHLTPGQSPLWRGFPRQTFFKLKFSLEISAVGENEKPIRKDERRKDLEVICQSGLNWTTFATWSYRYLNPKQVIQRALKLPSPTHAFLPQNFTNPSPCSLFVLRLRGRPISARKQHVGS